MLIHCRVLDKHFGKEAKFTSVEKTVTWTETGEAQTFKQFDSDQTIIKVLKNRDVSDVVKQQVLNSVDEYMTDYKNKATLSEKPGSSGATHWADIEAITDQNNRMGGSCDL